MKKKVVLAGGTGLVGTYFEQKFKALGYEVLIISRQAGHIAWTDSEKLVEALSHAEMLINLAGKSVNCRYNEKNKREILLSRTETTKALGDALLVCPNPPALWINSSTATLYRHAEDRPMTEDEGEVGSGFSVEVAKEWEKLFFSYKLPNTRQIALRISIVLGKDGGVIPTFRNLVKFGIGGAQGNGKQKFSWIHIEDLYRIVLFLQENESLSGVFNCASPQPVSNRELMKQLRKALGAKIGLPAPEWLLEMGAVIIRTETELILKSRWVIPERLEKAGFTFQYRSIDKALQQIFL